MGAIELVKAAEAAQEPLEPSAIVEAGTWVPRNVRDIEWALECVGESEAELADLEAQEADFIARVRARTATLRASAERRIAYFKGRVAEYADVNRDSLLTGRAKSRSFVAGKVGWRKKGGRLRVEDKEALSDWLSSQDASLYRVKIEPEMAALQQHCKATGEVPPGTTFEEERDEVYVEAVSLALPAKEE